MTENMEKIKKALGNLNDRVKVLEEMKDNLTSAISGEKKSSAYIDVLGKEKFIQYGTTIRIKNAYLIYPNLTVEAANGEFGAGTTLAIDKKDAEVIDGIKKAFLAAFKKGQDSGKIKFEKCEDYFRKKPNQKPFRDSVEDIISPNMKKENASKMREFAESDGGKVFTRVYNAMTEREDKQVIGINTVVKDINGNDVDPKILRNFQKVEVVLTFSPYEFGSSSGVSQYIQGIKLNEEVNRLGLWM